MGFLENFDQFVEEDVVFFSKMIQQEAMIRELLVALGRIHEICFDVEEVLGEFIARERKGSTAVMRGVAIPHIRTDRFDQFFMMVGLHPEGVNFHSLDKSLTHLVVLTIFPEENYDLAMKFLAGLSRFFLKKDKLAMLLKLGDPKEIHQLLRSSI